MNEHAEILHNRLPIRKLPSIALIGVLFVIGIVWLCWGAIEEWRDNYRAAWVADLVIKYIEMNDHWPAEWSDLKQPYLVQVDRLGDAWSFDELRSRVTVKFNVDLDNAGTQFISLKSGRIPGFRGEHPDAKILDFLKRRADLIDWRKQQEKILDHGAIHL